MSNVITSKSLLRPPHMRMSIRKLSNQVEQTFVLSLQKWSVDTIGSQEDKRVPHLACDLILRVGGGCYCPP